jgi:benzoyl-CoA reductase/2-hydroxyglutaryl-CoA dehydratase subunit BcrC/BadD/HgdB
MMDLIVAETTCDGKKKMIEIMAESRPVYVLELPQREDSSRALDRWTEELRKLKAHLECQFHRSITDDDLRRSIRTMNRERASRRSLAGLMKSPQPPLSGRELLQFKSTISGIPSDLAAYEKALAAYQSSPCAKKNNHPVRVLLTGVPIVHGAERVVEIIEDLGGLVVCQENCTGLKPILEDVDESAPDPIRALAEKYLHLPCSVKTPNWRRFESIRQLAREYRAECVIELIWQACLTYDVESYHIKRIAETELNLPYLKIQTDYSPSDSARIAVRVEALFEIVRNGTRSMSGGEESINI